MSNAATEALPLANGTFSKQTLYNEYCIEMLYHLTLSTSHIGDSGLKKNACTLNYTDIYHTKNGCSWSNF